MKKKKVKYNKWDQLNLETQKAVRKYLIELLKAERDCKAEIVGEALKLLHSEKLMEWQPSYGKIESFNVED